MGNYTILYPYLGSYIYIFLSLSLCFHCTRVFLLANGRAGLAGLTTWRFPRPPMYFLLLLLVGLISDIAFSFVILPSKVLLSTRLDPIVQPGVASAHLHNIVGGNRFNATYDSGFLLSSTCTTSPITVDKSAYWAPAMYFMNQTTSPMRYTRIPSSFNIYYLPRGDPGNVTAFPEGFRMVAGDASRNTYNASLFGDQAISWVCLDFNNPAVNGQQTPGFPTTNCPGVYLPCPESNPC